MKCWVSFVWLLQAILAQGLVLPSTPPASPIAVNETTESPWWTMFLTPEFKLASLQSKVAKKEKQLTELLSEIAALQSPTIAPASSYDSLDKIARSAALNPEEMAAFLAQVKTSIANKVPSGFNVQGVVQAKLDAISTLMASKLYSAVPKDVTSANDVDGLEVSKRMTPEDFATLLSQIKFLYADKIPGDVGGTVQKALQDRIDAIDSKLIVEGASPTAAELAGEEIPTEIKQTLQERLEELVALLGQFKNFFADRVAEPVSSKIQNALQVRIDSIKSKLVSGNLNAASDPKIAPVDSSNTVPTKRVSLAPEEFATLLGDIKAALSDHITGPLGDKIQAAIQARIDAVHAAELANESLTVIENSQSVPPKKRLAPDEFAALLGGIKAWVTDNIQEPTGGKIANAIQTRIDAVKAKIAEVITETVPLATELPVAEKRLAPDEFAAILGGMKSWVSENLEGPVGTKIESALEDRITAIQAKLAAQTAATVPVPPANQIASRSVEKDEDEKAEAVVTAATQVVDGSNTLEKPSYVAVFPPPSFWASYFAPYLQQTPPPPKTDDDDDEVTTEKWKAFSGKGKGSKSSTKEKSSKSFSSSKDSRSISFYSLF